MGKHWKSALWLAVGSVVAIVVGLLISRVAGVVALLVSVVAWFLIGISWMQPRGYDEHDATGRVDPKAR